MHTGIQFRSESTLEIDLGSLLPFEDQVPRASLTLVITQALLKQHTHNLTSFLYTPRSYLRNIEKVDIGYYAPAAQTTLNHLLL
jgi:hypothetical protein